MFQTPPTKRHPFPLETRALNRETSRMSEKGRVNIKSREERLAEQLRANLRRRKQAARKAKSPAPHSPQDTLKDTPSDTPSKD